MLPRDIREHPRALRLARLHSLLGVARAYRLDPRRLSDGVWGCVCPGCAERARTLTIRVAPTGGVGFGCPLCGAHGSRVGALQRLAERGTVVAALARLDELVAVHGAARLSAALARSGDPVAAVVTAALSDAGEQMGPAYLPGPVRDVQAANDDVCRCPSCEGRDDRGEGDA